MNGLTRHAIKRCQQRGIPSEVVDYLFRYGEFHHVRYAEICHFSKRSVKRIQREGGRSLLQKLEKHLKCYLVYRDGCVLTVAHGYKPLKCH